MKITKWVDMGAEVEVEIGADDIRIALSEAFSSVEVQAFDAKPTRFDVTRALNDIAAFFNAITDEHIGLLNDAQREVTEKFLRRAADRFKGAPVEVAQ
jgi:hypothetical protein